MNYELAKKLKDAGFPQLTKEKSPINHMECYERGQDGVIVFTPDLSELIEACGNRFDSLEKDRSEWIASWEDNQDFSTTHTGIGTSPEIAVANLWLELNKNEQAK